MDVKIKTEDSQFKLRACSVIVKNGKALLQDLNHNGFLCASGGHIHLGEDSRLGVIRETIEEVGVTVENPKLLAVGENFYTKNAKKFHEISFYYLFENPEMPQEKLVDYAYDEDDEGKMVHIEFRWVPLNEVDNFDIRPKALKEILKNYKNNSITHFLVKEK